MRGPGGPGLSSSTGAGWEASGQLRGQAVELARLWEDPGPPSCSQGEGPDPSAVHWYTAGRACGEGGGNTQGHEEESVEGSHGFSEGDGCGDRTGSS